MTTQTPLPPPSQNPDAKIIIIGSGAFGLSSALHLAEKGYTNITVFDRGNYHTNLFNPLRGADAASTDLNKLVRASYVDKIHYQNLAVQSIKQYYEWNKQIQKAAFLPKELAKDGLIFKNTGYIRLDDIDSGEEERNLANFSKIGLRSYSYDINNPEDIERSKITGWFDKLDPLSQRGKVAGLNGVLDSFAGVVYADKALLWVKYLAERTGNVQFVYGAEEGAVKQIIFSDEEEGKEKKEEAKKVKGIVTNSGKTYFADYVVVAAGAWSTQFAPQQLSQRIESVASSYVVLEIPKNRPDLIEKYQNIPDINYRMTYESNFREDAVYVFPATSEGYLKIGVNDHYWRHLEKIEGDDDESKHKSSVEKYISKPETSKYHLLPLRSLNNYKKFIKQHLSDIYASGAKIEKSKLCFAPVAQQNEFVIDFVPQHKNLIIASGGGFHGFKFLPVVGRFVEGLISGNSYEYAEKFKFDSLNNAKDYDRGFVNELEHKYVLNSTEYPKKKTEYYTYEH